MLIAECDVNLCSLTCSTFCQECFAVFYFHFFCKYVIICIIRLFVVYSVVLHCKLCPDDNMSTCSVDEADFQPLQDQLMTLDAADSDAESVDSEQENALK